MKTLLEMAREKRAEVMAPAEALITVAETESRDLTPAEFDQIKAAKDAAKDLDERIAELTDLAERNAAAAKVVPAGVGGAVVRNEARTYRPDASHSYFADLYASTFRQGDWSAAEDRLTRHNREVEVERRDIVTSALAGSVPPQYLLDQWAPVARAGRPFLNSLNSSPLPPDGTSFIIPRGTTGSAAAMTAEGTGFNEQDMANTDLTVTVNLVTAQQDISRTLFMRGGGVVDSVIFPDLAAAVAVAGNVSAISGGGTAPQHRGVTQVAGINAVTVSTATVVAFWPRLADAIQRVNSNRFAPAQAIYMHPRRWGWLTAALDGNRPSFEFGTVPPQSVIGLGDAAAYGQVVGTLQGLPVITDASIPTNLGAGTNEDIVIVARTADFGFWESDVMTFSFEQALPTAPGQVRLAVGQFQAFTAGRYPSGISTVGGAGLVPPTF